MDSARIDHMAARVRTDWPHAVEHGTYPALFHRNERSTLYAEVDGPPVFLEGGVAAGSYTYRPDGTTLTGEEYAALCAILDAPQAQETTSEERARVRRERAVYGRVLTASDRRRNAVRARATEGSKYA